MNGRWRHTGTIGRLVFSAERSRLPHVGGAGLADGGGGVAYLVAEVAGGALDVLHVVAVLGDLLAGVGEELAVLLEALGVLFERLGGAGLGVGEFFLALVGADVVAGADVVGVADLGVRVAAGARGRGALQVGLARSLVGDAAGVLGRLLQVVGTRGIAHGALRLGISASVVSRNDARCKRLASQPRGEKRTRLGARGVGADAEGEPGRAVKRRLRTDA